MTSEKTPTNPAVQKLQRAIVDGLEDVKGQEIVVFNTEHLSPLFERVIIASGTSNRQTRALASSIVDAVRDAGFDKPRIEGEENGEWIIVDCGAAVAHVMQPAIRKYYHLEEIWGGKVVRLKHAAAEKQADEAAKAPVKRAKKGGASEVIAEVVPARKAPSRKRVAAAEAAAAAVKPVSARKVAAKVAASRAAAVAAEQAPAVKKAPKKAAAPKATSGTPIKTVVVGKPAVKKSVEGRKAPVARKSPTRAPRKPTA